MIVYVRPLAPSAESDISSSHRLSVDLRRGLVLSLVISLPLDLNPLLCTLRQAASLGLSPAPLPIFTFGTFILGCGMVLARIPVVECRPACLVSIRRFGACSGYCPSVSGMCLVRGLSLASSPLASRSVCVARSPMSGWRRSY